MVCRVLRLCTIAALVAAPASAFAALGRDGGAGKFATENERIHHDHDAASINTREDNGHIIADQPRLSLAPMMDYTDRHFRAMVRLVSARTLLHTEMVAADELLDAGRDSHRIHQLLGQSATIAEGPSVLQFGGNDASQLHRACKLYHKHSRSNGCKYESLNLNCGCPSPAVSGKKCFGAALMRDPSHVVKLARAMSDGVEGELPVTVKCRIGLYEGNDAAPFSLQTYNEQSNEQEYEKLRKFVDTVAGDGIVTSFQIHARIAVLGGSFSPAENRKVPPLKYDHVRRLAKEYPELKFVLNGGIHSLAQAKEELEADDSLGGIMVGRALVADPWSFAMADELLYGDDDGRHQLCANRRELLQAYGRHADHEELHNQPAHIRRSLVAACAHLFAGEANSRQFRMELDELAERPERLEREATAQIWSSSGSGAASTSQLASAFSDSAKQPLAAAGWDDMQAMDEVRPAWDENEPPLSELILEAAQRNFGDELLDLGRRESHDKKIWQEEEHARRRRDGRVLSVGDGEKVSGGVVDGWFTNGLS